MIRKVISIIVPTYNMQEYLHRCLDSFLGSSYISSKVEVVIVNDGSLDNSLVIAEHYRKLNPELFTIINKSNGNYGSCINAAIPVLKGKYVKILDADDYYDTNEFVKMVDVLEKIECDLFISEYKKVYIDGKEENRLLPNGYDKIMYSYGDIFKDQFFSNLQMHAIGYKTDFLRKIGYKQTEGISYTDVEWCYKPIFYVEKVAIIYANVYRYFLGREGQTMSEKVLLRSLPQELIGVKEMLLYKMSHRHDVLDSRDKYLHERLCHRAFELYLRYLVRVPDKDFKNKEIEELDNFLKQDEVLYLDIAKRDIRSYLVRKWRSNHKRLPTIVRVLLKNNYDIIKIIYLSLIK